MAEKPTWDPTSQPSNTNPSKKRIPKACGSCRQSKVKCDGQRPCSRCRSLSKTCVFIERPRDPTQDRLENLEEEVNGLRETLRVVQTQAQAQVQAQVQAQAHQRKEDGFGSPAAGPARGSSIAYSSAMLHELGSPQSAGAVASPALQTPSNADLGHSFSPQAPTSSRSIVSPSSLENASISGQHSRKRKRARLELRHDSLSDFVNSRLITLDQARSYFDTFFRGCDRYVPVFDPSYDTFESVKFRNSLLFNAICAVGCSIQGDASSQVPHVLNFELKKLLNLVILSREDQCLEAVQALLVIACYSPERSLILSFATRMALDLGLPDAFEELTRKLMAMEPANHLQGVKDHTPLMRQSRTWFGLLVLEHILRVDAGKLPGFSSKGGARRCRVLLQQPFSTPLDLRLLSQVELNFLRAKIHDSLGEVAEADDVDIIDDVRDARIDLDLWYGDWKNIIETSPIAGKERPSLLLNLLVQRHWSEAMAYFRAVRRLGTENVDAMPSIGRNLLHMAKESLKKHLAVILADPTSYLANLRYAMDFVWAKCAFCFLLLLKLTRLLPDSQEDNSRLLDDGNALLSELNKVGTSAGSSTSRLYLQVLTLSVEKYGRALHEHQQDQPSTLFFWDSQDANTELQSFVPEQFVFEWEFPGLTLFSSPTAWQEFFDEFLLGFGGPEGGQGQIG